MRIVLLISENRAFNVLCVQKIAEFLVSLEQNMKLIRFECINMLQFYEQPEYKLQVVKAVG